MVLGEDGFPQVLFNFLFGYAVLLPVSPSPGFSCQRCHGGDCRATRQLVQCPACFLARDEQHVWFGRDWDGEFEVPTQCLMYPCHEKQGKNQP